MTTTILQGDCLQTLKTLDAGIVQTCVTSPPYYGLRDYGVDGQIGLEETPEAYVEKLVAVFREVRRVLADDGTLWIVIGDSYAAGKTGRTDQDRNTRNTDGRNPDNASLTGVPEGRQRQVAPGMKPKDLIGIPWMVAFALRADGWYLRSEIIWHKPNPMPESVTDRPTKSHEYIFLLSKSAQYYYDAEAIMEAVVSPERSREKNNGESAVDTKLRGFGSHCGTYIEGRNKRDVWTVTTKPYPDAHFATFPPDLIEPCILAGSREGDTVLDPFNGSGTTGAVAIKHHRNYIGCELNADYIKLTERRFAQVQPVLFPAQTGQS